MKKYLSISMMIICSLLTVTCEEVIRFDKDNQGGEIVIFARFANGLEGSSVSINLTSQVDRPPDPISLADVYVYDEEGNREKFSETDIKGVYRPREPALRRQPGMKYFLEVCVANGRSYRSELQEMRSIAGIDSVHFQLESNKSITGNGVEVEELLVNVILNSDLTEAGGEAVFLRWEVDEVYAILEAQLPSTKFPFYRWKTCYITNPVNAQNFLLFNGLELTSNKIENLRIASRVLDDTFAGKHYFNVVRYSMNFETYDYWSNANQLTDRVGSIFDAPPAALRSNIRNVDDPEETVLGFFEVVSTDTARFLVSPGDLPVNFDPLCKLPPEIDNVPAGCFSCVQEIFALKSECLECLRLKNSSLTRPDYF